MLGIRVERCVDAHSGVKDSVFILVDRAAFVEHRRDVSVRERGDGRPRGAAGMVSLHTEGCEHVSRSLYLS